MGRFFTFTNCLANSQLDLELSAWQVQVVSFKLSPCYNFDFSEFFISDGGNAGITIAHIGR